MKPRIFPLFLSTFSFSFGKISIYQKIEQQLETIYRFTEDGFILDLQPYFLTNIENYGLRGNIMHTLTGDLKNNFEYDIIDNRLDDNTIKFSINFDGWLESSLVALLGNNLIETYWGEVEVELKVDLFYTAIGYSDTGRFRDFGPKNDKIIENIDFAVLGRYHLMFLTLTMGKSSKTSILRFWRGTTSCFRP